MVYLELFCGLVNSNTSNLPSLGEAVTDEGGVSTLNTGKGAELSGIGVVGCLPNFSRAKRTAAPPLLTAGEEDDTVGDDDGFLGDFKAREVMLGDEGGVANGARGGGGSSLSTSDSSFLFLEVFCTLFPSCFRFDTRK